MKHYTNLYDVTKCTACRGCEVACKQWNQLPANPVPFTGGYGTKEDTDGKTYTVLKFWEEETADGDVLWRFRKHQCLHCGEPSCVKVCPTGALQKSEYGAVFTDYDKCIGCKYCVSACPFGVPKYDGATDKSTKCSMCADKLQVYLQLPETNDPQKLREYRNFIPACAKTCPSGAIEYGEKEQLMQKAAARVEELKATGLTNANLYNPAGVGGVNKVYVLGDVPEKYGLPSNPTIPAYINIWQPWIKPYGGVLIGLAALGAVGSFFSSRIIKVMGIGEKSEGGESHGA